MRDVLKAYSKDEQRTGLEKRESWFQILASKAHNVLVRFHVIKKLSKDDMPEMHVRQITTDKKNQQNAAKRNTIEVRRNQRPQAWISEASDGATALPFIVRALTQCHTGSDSVRGVVECYKAGGLNGTANNPDLSEGACATELVAALNSMPEFPSVPTYRRKAGSKPGDKVSFTIKAGKVEKTLNLAASSLVDLIDSMASGAVLVLDVSDEKTAKAIASERDKRRKAVNKANATAKATTNSRDKKLTSESESANAGNGATH